MKIAKFIRKVFAIYKQKSKPWLKNGYTQNNHGTSHKKVLLVETGNTNDATHDYSTFKLSHIATYRYATEI